MFSTNFTKAEVKALRLRHPKDLTSEELWGAYGPWVHVLATRVMRRSPFSEVPPSDLWGTGFLALQYSATRYDPAKGTFTTFFTRLVKAKMSDYMWKAYSHHRPRPSHYETTDPCRGSVLWTQAQFASTCRGEGVDNGSAHKVLGKIEAAAREMIRGNCNFYDLSPEEIVEATRLMERTQTMIKSLDQYGPKFRERVRRVMEDGDTARAVSIDDGINDSAVGYHIRDARLLLNGVSISKIRLLREARKNRRKAA